MGTNEKQEKLNRIAKEIITLSRSTLLVNLRFMDVALSLPEPYAIDTGTLMIDGRHIFYNPMHVLRCYKTAKELPVRSYLHMVMHCVFRHMYIGSDLNRAYWDLACDVAVEHTITELNVAATAMPDREQRQARYIASIQGEIKHITAENVYSYLCRTAPEPEEVIALGGLFNADSHELWYLTGKEIESLLGLDPGQGGAGTQVSGAWQTAAQRMQIDLDTFGRRRGTVPGTMIQNLAEVNREKCDYTAFLKKFAATEEAMRVNADEFDYIFYTYGLNLYGNMPLVEPLEYKEVKVIKEFVIAIDTSGSTSGQLVQRFVQKTYNILKSTESFSSRINLHIIQCDAAVQEDAKITSRSEFDEYLKTMKIRGLGGTDFRPVFEYVKELQRGGELLNLNGLIYFTDGFGVYPTVAPDYKTAFVFVEDEYTDVDVPSWAVKLILRKDEV